MCKFEKEVCGFERERPLKSIIIIKKTSVDGCEVVRFGRWVSQQPQGLRDLLVGLNGSHKSESGSAFCVIYDYISMII